jgi:membrane protease YdiL (CAAX protease family)
MEPETQSTPTQAESIQIAPDSGLPPAPPSLTPDKQEFLWLRRIFIGSQGLRAGWSIAIFFPLVLGFAAVFGFIFVQTHLIDPKAKGFTADSAFFGELIIVLGILGAASLVALIERRRGNFLAFNLSGPRGFVHFLSGLAVGFAALSALIGALAWGGWLHFGPVALSGADIFKFGAIWAAAFLTVGFVEEGIFRCYLLFTLTRGINLWWALGLVGVMVVDLLIRGRGNGIWGVYIMALLGLAPCLWLHLSKAESAGFWQAAWVTSTLFGFIHTGNGGENWIGIFGAAFIGLVFCVSVRVTGSAWWAIGCHAAWDWAETYFYGAADSGNVATGHYLTTSPAGAALWSGGTDGPEGSLLAIPIVIVILLLLLVLYGRKKPVEFATPALEQAAG